MQPFTAALYMTSATCLAVGGLAGIAWWRRRDLTVYGWFAVMALAAGLKVFMEPQFYQATSIDVYARALWWQIFFIIVFLWAFAWFLQKYTGVARRWIALLITGVLAADLILHWMSPHTLLFAEITELEFVTLPWGETLAVARGPATVFRPLVEAPGVFLAIMFADAAWGLWKRGLRRSVAVLSAAFVPFFVLFSLWGPLIDLGFVESPYLGTFAFLIIVLVFGSDLANDVVRASGLADELRQRDERWRSLLRDVHMAMVRIAPDGTLLDVNPFFCRLTGARPEDLLGRHFREILPTDHRERAERRFERLLRGEGEPHVDGSVQTVGGEVRDMLWSSVTIVDADGHPEGVITVGSDITQRVSAERARDEAIAELESLKDQLEEENLYLRAEITTTHGFDEIIGDGPALRYLLHRVAQVAETDATVLIEGETGVGKELVARAVHERSARADGPFVRINCGALPEFLIESELFGHDRGAFTGAVALRKGRFEVAHSGTLFLDEVGELPLALQSKLLRVLQEGEFERVGSSETRKADVRIVAATNKNLSDEVAAGRFRSDLFYRLHVYPITVPPLRDRTDDIRALVHHFVGRFAERVGRTITEIPQEVMRRLESYDWPGNVRELQNVLERAVIITDGSVLRLPDSLTSDRSARGAAPPPAQDRPVEDPPAPDLSTLGEVERRHIQAVLAHCGGKVSGTGGAAQILGLHPNTLRSRMKKLAIDARASGQPDRK